MSETETVAPANPEQPILANTMNVTKVAGFAAVITTVGGGRSAPRWASSTAGRLRSIDRSNLPPIAVAMVVAGYVAVDRHARAANGRSSADSYIKYPEVREDAARASADSNGHAAHLMAPGSPTA